jgi:hypothetical protein
LGDVGDRSSFYCVLNEAGEVILEERIATSTEAMKKIAPMMAPSVIAHFARIIGSVRRL